MLERRLAMSERAQPTDDPGLVLGDDGVVYEVASDGTRTALSAGALPSPIPGPITIAAVDSAVDPALTLTNSGQAGDLLVANGDDAQYVMDAEGLLHVTSDLGAVLHLSATGGTHAEVELSGVDGHVAQNEHTFAFQDATSATKFVVDVKVGQQLLLLAFTDVPDLSGFDPGSMAIWCDPTNGATKLMIKAVSNDGSVVSGSVALT